MEIDSVCSHQSTRHAHAATAKPSNIRISPAKIRDSQVTRKSLKPFSSSMLHEKKKIPTKEDILKINSKIELIKSKCMKTDAKLGRTDSRKTLSESVSNELNESVDIESEDATNTTKKINKMHLLRSKYADRPATIFFMYPKCCGISDANLERTFSIEDAQLSYKISGSEYKCIVNALEYNGFHKWEQGSDWNVYFDVSGTHLHTLETMNRHQKMNHFPGCWNLGRKDYMWKNLNKQRRSHPDAYNFVPNTFIFPADFERFQMCRQAASKNKLWIMKPTNQACGRGINMVTKQKPIKNKKDVLVSEYISNPHLINNYKYDLRIYIVVTSYDPLRIYMFKEGLTRFATCEYTTKVKDASKRFMHLTNFSVNKHSKKFVKNSQPDQDGQGSKWSLTALRKYYESIGIDSQKLFDAIKDVIIMTCISAEPTMLDIHSKTQEKRTCGFELYGFDILIDSNLKPWLMEVNICPSLSSSSPLDRRIKHTLLVDILNLIGIDCYSKKHQQQEQKRKKQRLLMRSQQDKKYYSKNINNLQQLNSTSCIQILSPEDWMVLFESEEELDRLGHFERIFPLKSNVQHFKKLFEINRYNNNVLWKNVVSEEPFLERLYN